jgi:hypothetical protein
VTQPALLLVEPTALPLVRCREYKRPLRVSAAAGVGPECRVERFAGRRFEVEQDELPGM